MCVCVCSSTISMRAKSSEKKREKKENKLLLYVVVVVVVLHAVRMLKLHTKEGRSLKGYSIGEFPFLENCIVDRLSLSTNGRTLNPKDSLYV